MILILNVIGYDTQEVIVKLLSEANSQGGPVGLDCSSGEV